MSAIAAGAGGGEARSVSSGGASFTYLEEGVGTPLVLLHGIGSAARSWQHQLAGLAAHFRVIAWDAPGYGGSSTLAPERPDAGDYARALGVMLGALGVERCHLVGHSFGCVTAARYARLEPQRILSLTLSGVAGGHARLAPEERERLRDARLTDLAELGPRGMAEKRAPRLLGTRPTDEARRAVAETMAMLRPDGYTQAVHALSGADTREDVLGLAPGLRVQFIYGSADRITTPDQNLAIARARPQAPVHVLEGAGHAPYLEQPQAYNALLLDFVQAEA